MVGGGLQEYETILSFFLNYLKFLYGVEEGRVVKGSPWGGVALQLSEATSRLASDPPFRHTQSDIHAVWHRCVRLRRIGSDTEHCVDTIAL
jgi:hypothetical protein